MKRQKFLQDAKADPSRFYRNPADVIRDRRLSNEDRLEILAAWEREEGAPAHQAPDSERVEELRRLRRQLEQTPAAGNPAPEPV